MSQLAATRGENGASGSANWIDPQALMRIKSLQLRAKAVVEGFLAGLHRSPHHGFSVEFTEYRQYSPGDDLRYLDWRLYARTDRYYIKRFEDETNLRCYLLVDQSRSMGYGSLGYTKAEYARTLAATLGFFLSQQRDAVGLLTFDRDVTQYMPARFRPGHLHRLMLALEQPLSGEGTDLSAPLEHIARIVAKRGLVLLISDLLAPVDTLQKHLGYLRTRGHDVMLFRVLDPAERNFEFDEATMFVDLESGRQMFVDPAEARATYLDRWQQHADRIRTVCANLGIDLYEATCDQPMELVLFNFLQSRGKRGRPLRRRAGRGGRRR
jgi:uncharacterized protein (DUF58 family)